MVTKKKNFNEQLEEELILEDALLYKRGDYWHVRFWLAVDKKYARFSLRTKNKSTAIDKAKKHFYELKVLETQGKKYYSITTADGVAMYLEKRLADVRPDGIVIGRYNTIKAHLKHWLEFIGKDLKLKELERTDCEEYFYKRTQGHQKATHNAAHATVLNEQSTINAMMKWLYARNETNIDSFEFAKIKAKDKGDNKNRRGVFDDEEYTAITKVIDKNIKELRAKLDDSKSATTFLGLCFLGILMITGMRRGELLQLQWRNINLADKKDDTREIRKGNLIQSLYLITVEGRTSKNNKTRTFGVRDGVYIDNLENYYVRYSKEKYGFEDKIDLKTNGNELYKLLGDRLVISLDGKSKFREQTLQTLFYKVLAEAKVTNISERNIVPYSFRHTHITRLVSAGLTPIRVAEMVGNTATEIERTYYKTTRKKMIENALVDYDAYIAAQTSK